MLSSLIAVIAGCLSWTFAEYALHNWAGHVARGRNHLSRDHLKHHANNRYFSPSGHKALAALAAAAVIAPLAVLVAGTVAGICYTIAFVAAYLAYEIMHRRAHTHPPRTRYGRWQRKHHFHHHFAAPKKNHGVTTPWFDMLLRSYERPGRVRVPERHAMDWLVDPRTGDVFDAYRDDYCIARVRPRQGVESATS